LLIGEMLPLKTKQSGGKYSNTRIFGVGVGILFLEEASHIIEKEAGHIVRDLER
jgi:hypothetical protein